MSYVQGKRVIVTGGAGFLGREVCAQLASLDPDEVFVPRSVDYDLRDRRTIRRMLLAVQPEIVIHLAAVVGGIGANRAQPGRHFYDNAVMGLELTEQCRLLGVDKLVLVGSVCSYPKHTPVPFREDNLWDGYPEETNAPYGIAKKMLLVQAQAYRQQYGFNAITLLPVNLYGPGDNFDPGTSHVIPALIRKVVEARQSGRGVIDVWGSGRVSREFLFVHDAAQAVVQATERYNQADPVNLGSGSEITIRDLAKLICRIGGFRGHLRFDPNQPDGQPRRCLDTTRAWQQFGFRATTSLENGLAETLDWYTRQLDYTSQRRAA